VTLDEVARRCDEEIKVGQSLKMASEVWGGFFFLLSMYMGFYSRRAQDKTESATSRLQVKKQRDRRKLLNKIVKHRQDARKVCKTSKF
jgi:hypothetical protein